MFQQQKENRLQHFDLQAIKELLLYSKRDLNPHSRNGQRILSPSRRATIRAYINL